MSITADEVSNCSQAIEKGMEAIIYEIILLQAELHMIQAANKVLAKRRQAKYIRL